MWFYTPLNLFPIGALNFNFGPIFHQLWFLFKTFPSDVAVVRLLVWISGLIFSGLGYSLKSLIASGVLTLFASFCAAFKWFCITFGQPVVVYRLSPCVTIKKKNNGHDDADVRYLIFVLFYNWTALIQTHLISVLDPRCGCETCWGSPGGCITAEQNRCTGPQVSDQRAAVSFSVEISVEVGRHTNRRGAGNTKAVKWTLGFSSGSPIGEGW